MCRVYSAADVFIRSASPIFSTNSALSRAVTHLKCKVLLHQISGTACPSSSVSAGLFINFRVAHVPYILHSKFVENTWYSTRRSICDHSTAQVWIHPSVHVAVVNTLDPSILSCAVTIHSVWFRVNLRQSVLSCPPLVTDLPGLHDNAPSADTCRLSQRCLY